MKKIIFMFFVALSASLTACSCFDSPPLEPKIIGTGNLQQNTKSKLWFVAIASTQYAVDYITIRDNNPRSTNVVQNIEPIEGMLVTIFISERKTGVQAVAGKQSAQQIEELYHTNSTCAVILLIVLSLCIFGIAFLPNKKQVRTINADA